MIGENENEKINEQTKSFLLYGIEDVIKTERNLQIRWSNLVSSISIFSFYLNQLHHRFFFKSIFSYLFILDSLIS